MDPISTSKDIAVTEPRLDLPEIDDTAWEAMFSRYGRDDFRGWVRKADGSRLYEDMLRYYGEGGVTVRAGSVRNGEFCLSEKPEDTEVYRLEFSSDASVQSVVIQANQRSVIEDLFGAAIEILNDHRVPKPLERFVEALQQRGIPHSL